MTGRGRGRGRATRGRSRPNQNASAEPVRVPGASIQQIYTPAQGDNVNGLPFIKKDKIFLFLDKIDKIR